VGRAMHGRQRSRPKRFSYWLVRTLSRTSLGIAYHDLLPAVGSVKVYGGVLEPKLLLTILHATHSCLKVENSQPAFPVTCRLLFSRWAVITSDVPRALPEYSPWLLKPCTPYG